MFVDLEDQPELREAEADVCVVGAGAAGISIARELCGRSVSVILLEAGGLTLEPETQALYEGENVGVAYGGLDQTRVRYFGGSTNPEGWGGWCKPLDPLDFEARPWVSHSGWPFGREELDPWYWRAQSYCEAGPFDYDLEHWRQHADDEIQNLAVDGGTVVTEIVQLSRPTRFGRRYHDELDAAKNVTVVLHANVTEIASDPDGATAQAVVARTLGGNELRVRFRLLVLAAGAIENARLLLASRCVHPAGIGNENDLVGRFFADHPRLDLGAIHVEDGELPDLYDPYVRHRHRSTSVGTFDPSVVAAGLALAPATQVSHEILNYRAWLVASYPGYGSEAEAAMKRLYFGVHAHRFPATPWTDLRSLVRRPHHALGAAVARLVGPGRLTRTYRLVNLLEAEPLPDSRLRLGRDRDRLGMQRVRVDWRVGDLVHKTLASAHEILDEELARWGWGRLVEPYRPGEEDRFYRHLSWGWHHMGTTRMHERPEYGVVDADCRVHSTANVYVAGSSVFPTTGNDMPTLTIVALALRLAAHVATLLETPSTASTAQPSQFELRGARAAARATAPRGLTSPRGSRLAPLELRRESA